MKILFQDFNHKPFEFQLKIDASRRQDRTGLGFSAMFGNLVKFTGRESASEIYNRTRLLSQVSNAISRTKFGVLSSKIQ